jgi:outer membrane lipoprotein SlyB
MNPRSAFVVVILAASVLLSGCPSNLSGDSYSRAEARQVQRVQFATVEHVRPVVIEGTSGVVGGATGAAVGGLAGSTIGGDTGSKIAAVLGAVAGGLAGAAAEEGMTRAQGVEVTVTMEDGRTLAIVQEAEDHVQFRVGDRVRVLTINGTTRVAY